MRKHLAIIQNTRFMMLCLKLKATAEGGLGRLRVFWDGGGHGRTRVEKSMNNIWFHVSLQKCKISLERVASHFLQRVVRGCQYLLNILQVATLPGRHIVNALVDCIITTSCYALVLKVFWLKTENAFFGHFERKKMHHRHNYKITCRLSIFKKSNFTSFTGLFFVFCFFL